MSLSGDMHADKLFFLERCMPISCFLDMDGAYILDIYFFSISQIL